MPKLQARFAIYCDNFPKFCPIDVFSSEMTSTANEDNFQLFSVTKRENQGEENYARKFDVL